MSQTLKYFYNLGKKVMTDTQFLSLTLTHTHTYLIIFLLMVRSKAFCHIVAYIQMQL